MTLQKIFAWILIASGIVIILWSIWSSYQIFGGKTSAPKIFSIENKKEAVLPQKGKTTDLERQMEETIQKTISEQLNQLLPADFLPKLFNLISWSIFAWILILAGAKISGLGVHLLRK